MATPIYAPNPVSVLPNVDQVYNAPREPSALEVGTLAALRAGGEVMDALRERRNTIAQLNAAAEAIEGVDPTQAEIYRKMAGSVQAYIPHSGGGPGGAAAGSRAARGVQGDLLNNMIKFAQETSLMRQQQQNALERIGMENQARMSYLQKSGELRENLAILEDNLIKNRESQRQASAVMEGVLELNKLGAVSDAMAREAASAHAQGDYARVLAIGNHARVGLSEEFQNIQQREADASARNAGRQAFYEGVGRGAARELYPEDKDPYFVQQREETPVPGSINPQVRTRTFAIDRDTLQSTEVGIPSGQQDPKAIQPGLKDMLESILDSAFKDVQ